MKNFIFTIILSISLAYIACGAGDIGQSAIKSKKLDNINKIERCCL